MSITFWNTNKFSKNQQKLPFFIKNGAENKAFIYKLCQNRSKKTVTVFTTGNIYEEFVGKSKRFISWIPTCLIGYKEEAGDRKEYINYKDFNSNRRPFAFWILPCRYKKGTNSRKESINYNGFGSNHRPFDAWTSTCRYGTGTSNRRGGCERQGVGGSPFKKQQNKNPQMK